MPDRDLQRLVIAGLAGDGGKSLVSVGIIGALRSRGIVVAPYKKGPDFIDAAWLGAAAGAPGHNLDTFLMPESRILASVAAAGRTADLAIVEGNRGLFDGLDAKGSHSTAVLARLLRAPVILVIDVRKVTRTAAALVAGCRALDPDLSIQGVILNRVGTARQEALIRESIQAETGIPVVGAIPRLSDQHLPSRHLGLLTTVEHTETTAALEAIARLMERYVDLDAILDLLKHHDMPSLGPIPEPEPVPAPRVRIGVLQDRAFSFYYPENLHALRAAGAELVPISTIEDDTLPQIDALYAGGGFPEIHAADLSANVSLRKMLCREIQAGLPVWAECGGLMYLSRELLWLGEVHPMVGALPVAVEQTSRPQGHGYVEIRADRSSPFFPEGTRLRGHEFHYSRPCDDATGLETTFEVVRGVGIGAGRDGIRVANLVATYTHLHALGVPEWAEALVDAAAGVPS
ncbi:MAG: cobyrinate a,c-diamide synthase [Planctomycetota bacterium]